MTDKKRIGFIGVGLMGHGMAKNILNNGYPLTVTAHNNRAPVESLLAQGATEANNAAALARCCDIVFLCVTASPQVEEVVLGADGLLKNGAPGLIIVDTGTSEPQSTRRINAAARAAGMFFADAPLTRSPAKAEEGQLVGFIAAETPLYEKIKPVLETFCEYVIHIGETVGAAHEIKLLNNFVATGCAALWAEAYSACLQSGNDPAKLHAVISSAGLNCLNFQNFSKFALENDASAHKFSLANCAKDSDYYVRYADAAGHSTLLADAVRQTYKLAVANGYGEKYVPELTAFLRHLNGGA